MISVAPVRTNELNNLPKGKHLSKWQIQNFNLGLSDSKAYVLSTVQQYLLN